MGWWGKAVGGTLGLLVGGPLGAMVGATMGHGVDRGVDRVAALFAPERARLQAVFLESTFAVLGHLAKSDGRVSEREIAFAESVMVRMGLSRLMRQTAIQCFNQGKAANFDLGAAVATFRQASAGQTQLHRIFLEIQIAAAYTDGGPTARARLVLEQCREGLHISLASFRRLEQLIQFQHGILGATAGWRSGGWRAGWERLDGDRPSIRASLAEAYQLLGITPRANDEEVKRAYRKLMNRHHPDKLMSRGAPEEAIKMASQKTHEIRRAYETITEARAR